MEADKTPRNMESSPQGPRRQESFRAASNLKWLEETRKDMEENVAKMKNLIEEDANSFAQRAEMFYEKRPELMRLVEKVHGSFRALAERYGRQQESFEVIPPHVLASYGISQDPSHTSPNSNIHKLRTSLSILSTQKHDIGSSSSDSDTELPSPLVNPSYVRSGSKNQLVRRAAEGSPSTLSSSSSSSPSSSFSSSEGKALKMENESLRQELERCSSEQKAMELRMVSLQEELEVLKSQKVQLSVDKRSSESELSRLHEQLESLKKKNTQLSAEGELQVRRWEEELRRVHSLLKDSEGLKNALELQLRKLQQELEATRSDAVVAMENLSKRDKQVKRLEEEALKRESFIEALQRELEGLHGERSQGMELSGILQEQLSQLQQELSRARDEAHRLSAEVLDKTAAMEKLEAGIRQQQEIVADLHRVISAMKEEERILRDRLEERGNQAESLHLQVQNLKAWLEDSRSRNRGLEEQQKALQRELDAAASEARAAMESLNSEKDLMAKRLEENIEDREKTIRGLQKELESFHGERSRGLELTDILEKQVMDLKQELGTSIKQLASKEESWNLEKTRLEEAIFELKVQEQERQIVLGKSDEQVKDLDMKLGSLTSRSRETEESLQFHQVELSRVQAELSERSEMVHKLEEEIESLLKMLQPLLQGEQNGSSNGSSDGSTFRGVEAHDNGHVHLHEPKHHKLRDLRDGLLHLITDKRRIEGEATGHGSMAKELEQQLISLREELETVRSALTKRDAESLEQSARLGSMDVRVMELQEMVKDLEERLEEKSEELSNALSSGSEEMMFLTQEMSKLQGLHGKLQKERSDLIQERERSLVEHRLIRQALTEAEKELAAENGRNSLLEDQLKEARSRAQELEAMASRLEADKSAFCADISFGMGELKRQNNGLMERLQQESRALEAMAKELAAENSRNSSLEGQLREARSKVEELEAMASRLEEERVSAGMDLEQKVNDYVELEAAMAALRSECALLRHQKETLSEELAARADKIGELQEAIAIGAKVEEEGKKCREMYNLKELELRQARDAMETLDQSFKKLKEQKISFGEAMAALPVESFHEVQERVNTLLEKLATAELAIASERKRGDERQSVMQQEVAFLREENQRLGFVIFDRCEEKREAIRQLCMVIDYLQEKNRRLEGAMATARQKIQQRSIVAARRKA